MKGRLKIGIIGAGNVAWQLGVGLEQAGHQVVVVSNRSLPHAEALSYNLYNALPTTQLALTDCPTADVYFLALPDNAVEATALQLELPPDAILLHTAGSLPLSAISITHTHTGVFYPLQTISKQHKTDWKNVTLCLEGSSPEVYAIIEKMGKSLSKKVLPVSSEQRAVLHLAAVMACNFSNHMYTLASALLHDNDLDFEMLRGLITETTNKAFAMPPADAQTGPAVRNDTQTIKKHLSYLQALHPPTADLYRKLTESIHEWHIEG